VSDEHEPQVKLSLSLATVGRWQCSKGKGGKEGKVERGEGEKEDAEWRAVDEGLCQAP